MLLRGLVFREEHQAGCVFVDPMNQSKARIGWAAMREIQLSRQLLKRVHLFPPPRNRRKPRWLGDGNVVLVLPDHGEFGLAPALWFQGTSPPLLYSVICAATR